MKKSYSSLSLISTFFIVLGYINLVIGLLFSAYALKLPVQEGEVNYNLLIGLGSIFGTALITLIFWAIGQFIKLFIDMADSLSTINENAFFIADYLAKNKDK